MARNLAQKFAAKVDEAFKLASLTARAVNNDYDWEGVDTVKVYSVNTVAPGNYQRSGTSRYGTPADLDDTVQTLKVAQDKAFTYIIDKGDSSSQLTVKDVNKSLRREIDLEIIPMVDKYRLSAWAAAATSNSQAITKVITPENAYEEFLKARAILANKRVPAKGRLCYATPEFINQIQLDKRFTLDTPAGQDSNYNGFAGRASGIVFIETPSDMLPANTNFLITHPVASPSPKKLEDYKVHTKPQGISGALVEGRILFDCFVLDKKKGAIVLHKSA